MKLISEFIISMKVLQKLNDVNDNYILRIILLLFEKCIYIIN